MHLTWCLEGVWVVLWKMGEFEKGMLRRWWWWEVVMFEGVEAVWKLGRRNRDAGCSLLVWLS